MSASEERAMARVTERGMASGDHRALRRLVSGRSREIASASEDVQVGGSRDSSSGQSSSNTPPSARVWT